MLVLPAVWTACKLVYARWCAWRADIKASNLTQDQLNTLNTDGTRDDWQVTDSDVDDVLKLRRTSRRLESYSGLLPNWVILCLAAGLVSKLGTLVFC